MRHLLLGVVLCFVCSSALAQESDPNAPVTREDVERYLNVTHSHQMMQQMMGAMAGPMHKMVHDEYLKQKDKLPADFEERTNKTMDDMFQHMPFDEMMQSMVPVYQKHFTKGDVDALTQFYSSPTGQKMLRELPAIMSEAMESMVPIMEKYTETVKRRVQDEFAQELQKTEKKSD